MTHTHKHMYVTETHSWTLRIDFWLPRKRELGEGWKKRLLRDASAFNSGELRKQVTFSLCESALGGFHLVFLFKGFIYIKI